MIDVSVIVPVYNVEKYLRPTIESILAQTHKNIELILVDDGSPDSSGAICDEYAKKDSRIKVIHKKNEGTGMARNSGFEAACGEYVHFCDGDDILDIDLVEDNYTLAKQNNADIITFDYKTVVSNNMQVMANYANMPSSPLDGLYTRREFAQRFPEAYRNLHNIWTKFYRREFLLQNGVKSTNQALAQDVLFVLDAFAAPFSGIYFNHTKPYYHHVLRPKSAVTQCNMKRFDCQFNTARHFERLLDSFEEYNVKYDSLLCSAYLYPVNMAFGTFSLSEAPAGLTFKQRTEIFKRIFAIPDFKRAVALASTLKNQPLSTKIKLFLYRHDMPVEFAAMTLIMGLFKKKKK